MLTTTRTSRTRLVAGAGVLSLCVAAGLSLTASGTAAAAKMRSTVADATGVDLASLDQSAVVPFAPATVPVPPRPAREVEPPRVAPPTRAEDAPNAPPTPEPPLPPSGVSPVAPASPEVPTPPEASGRAAADPRSMTTTVTVTKDGKRIVRYGRYVKLNRDGSYTVVGEIGALPAMPAIPPMPALPRIPNISSRTCGVGGKGETMVIKERSADGQRIIVCTDRIAVAAAKGVAIAANRKNIERNAYMHALSGLRDAKARMSASPNMSTDERKQALFGIDTAIRELESDLAKAE